MDDLYRENILEHYRHPQNYGSIPEVEVTFDAEGQNPLCGDEIKVQFSVDDSRMITNVKFSGHGCAISQAAMSMLSTELIGRSVDEVSEMSKDDVLDLLGIPLSPVRLKCAVLGLVVAKMGLHENFGTAAPEGWEGVDELSWEQTASRD